MRPMSRRVRALERRVDPAVPCPCPECGDDPAAPPGTTAIRMTFEGDEGADPAPCAACGRAWTVIRLQFDD